MTKEQVSQREVWEREHYAERIAEWAAGMKLPKHTSYNHAVAVENAAPELISSHARHLANPEQLAERHAFDLERNKAAITEWRNGGPISSMNPWNNVPVMLRLWGLPPSEEIETSWGARFPKEHAREALRYIQVVRLKGETWHSNGDQAPRLGYYKIDKITAAGDVRAGCHLVPWIEIERLAIELGWIDS